MLTVTITAEDSSDDQTDNDPSESEDEILMFSSSEEGIPEPARKFPSRKHLQKYWNTSLIAPVQQCSTLQLLPNTSQSSTRFSQSTTLTLIAYGQYGWNRCLVQSYPQEAGDWASREAVEWYVMPSHIMCCCLVYFSWSMFVVWSLHHVYIVHYVCLQ